MYLYSYVCYPPINLRQLVFCSGNVAGSQGLHHVSHLSAWLPPNRVVTEHGTRPWMIARSPVSRHQHS